jgi:hypothetical protein
MCIRRGRNSFIEEVFCLGSASQKNPCVTYMKTIILQKKLLEFANVNSIILNTANKEGPPPPPLV